MRTFLGVVINICRSLDLGFKLWYSCFFFLPRLAHNICFTGYFYYLPHLEKTSLTILPSI